MDLGKPQRSVLARTIWRMKGAHSKDVIAGPSPGVDVSVVKLGGDKVMLLNCDPISLLPPMGPSQSATMSVHEVASDVATTGHLPKFAMFDLNLPPNISDADLSEYWKSIHLTCKKLGVSILGGHTGRFEGCDYSIVGSATMWTTCQESDYLTTDMAEDGDDLILTKTAAYGATAVLSTSFPRVVHRKLGRSSFKEARSYLSRMSTIADSLTAAKTGIHEHGVSAIHNVGEGGVVAAVEEMSTASGLGAILDIESIPISESTMQLSRLFHFDPLTSLGEGSLLISSKPKHSPRVIRAANSNGSEATIIGGLSSKTSGLLARTPTRSRNIRRPLKDPYWNAYWRAVRKGWS